MSNMRPAMDTSQVGDGGRLRNLGESSRAIDDEQVIEIRLGIVPTVDGRTAVARVSELPCRLGLAV